MFVGLINVKNKLIIPKASAEPKIPSAKHNEAYIYKYVVPWNIVSVSIKMRQLGIEIWSLIEGRNWRWNRTNSWTTLIGAIYCSRQHKLYHVSELDNGC